MTVSTVEFTNEMPIIEPESDYGSESEDNDPPPLESDTDHGGDGPPSHGPINHHEDDSDDDDEPDQLPPKTIKPAIRSLRLGRTTDESCITITSCDEVQNRIPTPAQPTGVYRRKWRFGTRRYVSGAHTQWPGVSHAELVFRTEAVYNATSHRHPRAREAAHHKSTCGLFGYGKLPIHVQRYGSHNDATAGNIHHCDARSNWIIDINDISYLPFQQVNGRAPIMSSLANCQGRHDVICGTRD
jgi:hypothetical protein